MNLLNKQIFQPKEEQELDLLKEQNRKVVKISKVPPEEAANEIKKKYYLYDPRVAPC